MDDNFEGTLDARMAEKLKMDGFSDDDLKSLSGPVDFIELNKLAIDFADGVVQSSENVNPELIEYVKKSNKKFMPYPGKDNYIDAYDDFYKSL